MNHLNLCIEDTVIIDNKRYPYTWDEGKKFYFSRLPPSGKLDWIYSGKSINLFNGITNKQITDQAKKIIECKINNWILDYGKAEVEKFLSFKVNQINLHDEGDEDIDPNIKPVLD